MSNEAVRWHYYKELRRIRDMGRWGEQGGLLSLSEMFLLWELTDDYEGPPILEVGHYFGLSTITLGYGARRTVVTVDNQKGDRCVPVPAGVERFLENVGSYTDICPIFMDSQNLVAPLHYSTVFYDGDHGDEQMRFTMEVHKSPKVELFVFDDRDFPVPAQCCEYLRSMGWVDESPPVHRGPQDKASEETMTLGVFRRAST